MELIALRRRLILLLRYRLLTMDRGTTPDDRVRATRGSLGDILSHSQIVMLANLPSEVMEGFNALVVYGVNPAKLCNLIKRRTQPHGRPKKTDETARLVFSISSYQAEHPGATRKASIAAILELSEAFRKLDEEAQHDRIHQLETALRRHKPSTEPG